MGMLHGAPVVIMVWIEATTVDEQVAAWVTSLLQTPDAGPTLLFWDVRNDADALAHQLGIRVEARRVLGVQLLNTPGARVRLRVLEYRSSVSPAPPGVQTRDQDRARYLVHDSPGAGDAVAYAAFDVLAILFLFHELVAEGVVTRSQWNAIVRKSASDTDDFRTRDSPPRDGDTRLSSWKKW